MLLIILLVVWYFCCKYSLQTLVLYFYNILTMDNTKQSIYLLYLQTFHFYVRFNDNTSLNCKIVLTVSSKSLRLYGR